MVKLCVMASHRYPPGLRGVVHPEQGSSRLSENFHHFIPYHGSNQDLVNPLSFNLSLPQKEEWRSAVGLLDSNHFVRNGSTSKRSAIIDFQDTRADSVRFSLGIVRRCMMHEEILKLLSSRSIEEQGGLLDLPMLYDLMGPQSPLADLPQQPFVSCSVNDAQPQQYLIYPTKELYFNQPFLDLVGNSSSFREKTYHPDGQKQHNCTGIEMNDMLLVISDFYLSKNTNRSTKQTMLVPYFERRRRARANTDALKLATEKVGSLKSPDRVKEKTLRKKKKTCNRTGTERDIYSNSYLHACESLLSIIVDRKQHGKSAILSLKKSGPQLAELLTKFSAGIAGTGIAVVLSVFCRVACSRAPFCASKLLSTGFGLGLIWLSWAVNKLRNTVTSISKTSSKFGEKEEEMMNHLDRNLKDIYFRAAALMAVAVLKAA